jgi:hypothetical protein
MRLGCSTEQSIIPRRPCGVLSSMNYWLDLFTGDTWQQFRDAGATISGFRKTMARYKKQPQKGDILLCYLTGVKRWVGALEILGPSTDTTPIWKLDEFPIALALNR